MRGGGSAAAASVRRSQPCAWADAVFLTPRPHATLRSLISRSGGPWTSAGRTFALTTRSSRPAPPPACPSPPLASCVPAKCRTSTCVDARPRMCTCVCAGNVLHGENPRGRRIRHAGIPGACACAGVGGCVPPRESASASVLALLETGLRQTVRLVTARLSAWHLLAARLSARHLCCAAPRHTARMPLCVCAHASLPVNVRACVRDKRSPWQSKARRGPMV